MKKVVPPCNATVVLPSGPHDTLEYCGLRVAGVISPREFVPLEEIFRRLGYRGHIMDGERLIVEMN